MPGSGWTGAWRGSGRGVERARHHVLGQLEVGGARLLGLGHLERLAHDLGDDLRGSKPVHSTSRSGA